MNRLCCNVRKCNNNSFGMCHRGKIVVDGLKVSDKDETKCASFEKHRFLMRRKTNTVNEYFDKLEEVLEDKKTPEIICNIVNCKYNAQTYCKSNNVMIYGFKAKVEAGTRCNSFVAAL